MGAKQYHNGIFSQHTPFLLLKPDMTFSFGEDCIVLNKNITKALRIDKELITEIYNENYSGTTEPTSNQPLPALSAQLQPIIKPSIVSNNSWSKEEIEQARVLANKKITGTFLNLEITLRGMIFDMIDENGTYVLNCNGYEFITFYGRSVRSEGPVTIKVTKQEVEQFKHQKIH